MKNRDYALPERVATYIAQIACFMVSFLRAVLARRLSPT